MKILNLYAGIGGNRKLWGDEHEITAVENDLKIAAIYQKNFPKDKVIIADAHEFLREHVREFDFIWSSPPCPTHSQLQWFRSNNNTKFPDMKLYEEIIFLQWFCKTKWVVENVVSYYEPLIKPQLSGRHYFWANFNIGKINDNQRNHFDSLEVLERKKGFSIQNETICDKRKILRNCVEPEVGLHIFNMAFKTPQVTLEAI